MTQRLAFRIFMAVTGSPSRCQGHRRRTTAMGTERRRSSEGVVLQRRSGLGGYRMRFGSRYPTRVSAAASTATSPASTKAVQRHRSYTWSLRSSSSLQQWQPWHGPDRPCSGCRCPHSHCEASSASNVAFAASNEVCFASSAYLDPLFRMGRDVTQRNRRRPFESGKWFVLLL
jgi:hypothetical protein